MTEYVVLGYCGDAMLVTIGHGTHADHWVGTVEGPGFKRAQCMAVGWVGSGYAQSTGCGWSRWDAVYPEPNRRQPHAATERQLRAVDDSVPTPTRSASALASGR